MGNLLAFPRSRHLISLPVRLPPWWNPAYRGRLRQLRRFLRTPEEPDEQTIAWLLELSQEQARELAQSWVADMRARTLASNSIHSAIVMLRHVFREGCGWSLSVRTPKRQVYRDTQGPSQETIRRLLDATADDLRNRTLLVLMAGMGFRCCEVASIRSEDLDLDADPPGVWIRSKGKADRERVDLPPPVRDLLVALARETAGGPIFRSRRDGKPLAKEGIGFVLETISRRAGLASRVRPHSLRHAFVTQLLDEGASISEAQEAARHASPRTTMIYDDRRRARGAKATAVHLDRMLGATTSPPTPSK